MTLVRRARKSIRERRMKKCLDELTHNLSKVELRVHGHLKKRRMERRPLEPLPRHVMDGKLDEELYEIECRLHREAGLPPPEPPVELRAVLRGRQQQARGGGKQRLIGFLTLQQLAVAVHTRGRGE